MGWSRDLGLVATDEVEAKAKEATTVFTADPVSRTFLETSQLTEREAHTLPLAVAAAKAAVEKLGGKAHVWLGGQCAVNPDGTTTTSVSASVSVTTAKG
jgi:hypothetical protein